MRHRPEARDAGADQPGPLSADAAPAQPSAATEFETRTQRVADSTYIVSITGEIDLSTGPAFSSALHAALDAGASRLIVDLSECGFMDSTGISILVGANDQLDHSGKPVAVVTNHSHVLRVLQITAVDTILTLYPSRSAALRDGAGD
jgi:anti-sigma B factor antagonist